MLDCTRKSIEDIPIYSESGGTIGSEVSYMTKQNFNSYASLKLHRSSKFLQSTFQMEQRVLIHIYMLEAVRLYHVLVDFFFQAIVHSFLQLKVLDKAYCAYYIEPFNEIVSPP